MNTLEQAAERFAVLPSDFQEAIRNFDYDKRLHEVHKKFKLHIDQSFALEKIVGDVIFGDIHSIEMSGLLLNGLHTTKEQADEVAMEINEKILLPIREAIKLQQQISKESGQSVESDI